MTERLSEISDMSSDSRVLDLGCGRGRPLLDIAVSKGCPVVGVDLCEGNIEIANEYLALYKENNNDLKAEFYAASYFDLPGVVKKEMYSHVMMQTSLFYSHHRIDDVFRVVSEVLKPAGRFVATDFCRIADREKVNGFTKVNSMLDILSLDEIKSALLRHGLEYCGGENLDLHCMKCHQYLREKTVSLGLEEFASTDMHAAREEFVKNGLVTFQIILARKLPI